MVESLRASARTHVSVVRRQRDQRLLVAKVFDVVDETDEARVEHEFRLLRELEVDGVARALSLERAGRQVVLLLEWIPGRNLALEAGGEPLAVERVLEVGRSVAATLARIHDRRVLHRDIKPSNIVVEAETGRIVLVDFGISVVLERDRAHLYDPAMLAGTLPYVAPEQTGRTQREVDFRSDLYSLGVTLYELLTGHRPFEAAGPLELIHAHLALRPQPPIERIPTIPAQLSAIVMKLLEKAPEHRYQSARGLLADLDQLAGRDSSFALGTRDWSPRLQFPHLLIGREAERVALDAAFDRVIQTRRCGLVLLRGPAGVGKSALIDGLDARSSEHQAYFGVGRFEARTNDDAQPYRGFADALRAVMVQILTESDERLASWRLRLADALGPIASVIVDLVPELGLILGEVPDSPELELGESRNRLHLGFDRLVTGLAEAGLVLAFDDFQWADAGSVELLESMLESEVERPILFIAGYRPGPSELRERIVRLDLLDLGPDATTTIELGPLRPAAVTQLLAAALHRPLAEVEALAGLIGRKSDRNPLFIRQYLAWLVEIGIIRAGEAGWTWDLETVATAALPDDLLAIMRDKLGRLAASERRVLEFAACIGPTFELQLLEAVARTLGSSATGSPPADAWLESVYALEGEGLLSLVGRSGRFSHDGIRAAAYEGLEPSIRRQVHQVIGDSLLARRARGQPERVFEVVDHLNLAAEPTELEPPARIELGRLNLEAGQRALQTAAWRGALPYFEAATRLLGPGQRDADGFAAQFGLASASALAGDTDGADAAFGQLLEWELSMVDHARVVARRVQILKLQERLEDAVRYGREGLERCGIRLPAEVGKPRMLLALIPAWQRAKRVGLDQLLALPDAESAPVVAALHIISAMKWAAFAIDANLYIYLTAVHARLVLREGFHPTAVEGLAQLAFAGLAMGQVGPAVALSAAVVELIARRPTSLAAAIEAQSIDLMYVGPSGGPFRRSSDACEGAAKQAVEAGERLHAGYLGAVGIQLHLEAGTHLREILAFDARIRRENADLGSREAFAVAEIGRRLAATLAAEDPDSGPGFASFEQVRDDPAISKATEYGAVAAEVWGLVLLGEDERAWTRAELIARDFEQVLFGLWIVPRFAMLDAILVGRRARAGQLEPSIAIPRLRRRTATLRKWAKCCAENFEAGLEIVAGELAWLRGHEHRALDHLERARNLAARHRLASAEALACIETATLAEARAWTGTHEGALRGAHDVLWRWGAWGPMRVLERAHPDLSGADVRGQPTARTQPGLRQTDESGVVTEVGAVSSLDLDSVIGTMRIISEDLHLEQVISRVLGSAIANAGADRGALLLDRAKTVALVAEGDASTAPAYLDEAIPLREAGERLPTSAVNYALRTGESVVVGDAALDPRFAGDRYIVRAGVRSLLCMPIVKQNQRVGALVLENRLHADVFTAERLETLRLLLGQAASALDNARLYAQLERSEAEWRSLVDGVPDLIALMDGRGRVEFVNQAVVYGVPAFEVIGREVHELMEPSSAEAWRLALAEVVATGDPRELEICVSAPDRARQWFVARIAAVASSEGIGRYLSIATEVTARKQLEAQLSQQQRLDSVGTLASGVAHEINNPIQGILNYAELISMHTAEGHPVREFADEITHESKRVAAIVRNLLSFSRHEVDHPMEQQALADLVADTLSLVRAVLHKDQIELVVDVAADLPELRGRAQQVRQVVMNLITNARDALNERYPDHHPCKRIEVVAGSFERDGHSWLRLSVIDHGPGIPEHLRARIFDPFFTTKGRDQGTGLGLAISHNIAKDHGGELRVESEPELGTSFHLELPAALARGVGPAARD